MKEATIGDAMTRSGGDAEQQELLAEVPWDMIDSHGMTRKVAPEPWPTVDRWSTSKAVYKLYSLCTV
jgi:hypothetical protein